MSWLRLAAPAGVVASDESEEHRVDDLLGGQHLAVGDAGVTAGEGEQPDAVDDVGAGDDEAVLVVDEQLVDRREQRLVRCLVLLAVRVAAQVPARLVEALLRAAVWRLRTPCRSCIAISNRPTYCSAATAS